jgi:lipopolysaccharide export system protein LptA
MSRTRRAVIAATIVAALAPAAAAQPQPSGPPNALQGFSQNRDQPVKIDSATLEVRDKQKIATFGGNVRLVQGDTTLRCKTLVVYYDQDASPGAPKTGAFGPTGSQQIRRMEAKGGVIVTQKDQIASGDTGVYDMPSNTMTLIGSVTVTQGQNVTQGQKLIVDLTTGVSHVVGGAGGRVQTLIVPKNENKADNKADNKAETKPGDSKQGDSRPGIAPAAAPKQRPAQPSGLY